MTGILFNAHHKLFQGEVPHCGSQEASSSFAYNEGYDSVTNC